MHYVRLLQRQNTVSCYCTDDRSYFVNEIDSCDYECAVGSNSCFVSFDVIDVARYYGKI